MFSTFATTALCKTLYRMATQTVLKKILQNYASQMHTTNITKYIFKIYKTNTTTSNLKCNYNSPNNIHKKPTLC